MNKKIYAFILASILTVSINTPVQAEALSEAVVSGAALTVETDGSVVSGECVDEEISEEEASVYIVENTQEVTTEASASSDLEETTESEETNALEPTNEGEKSNLLKTTENTEIEYITLESVASDNNGFYIDNIYYNGTEVVCQWLKNIYDSENITIEYLPQGEEWQSADDIAYVTENGFYIKIALLEANTGYAFRPLYNGKKYKSIFIKVQENGVIIGSPRDITSDIGNLPDYTNAPGKFDFEPSADDFSLNKEESPSPNENKNDEAISDVIKKAAHSGSQSAFKTSGNSVIIGGIDEKNETYAEDIVLDEAFQEKSAIEESVFFSENQLYEPEYLQEDIIVSENIENNESEPYFTDNSLTSLYNNTNKTTAEPVSLKPYGYIGGGNTRFNGIVDSIITDKITEAASEPVEIYSKKENNSEIKSGEFYIGGKYNISNWLSGNVFPVVLAAAYMLLMGGIIAVILKKIKS